MKPASIVILVFIGALAGLGGCGGPRKPPTPAPKPELHTSAPRDLLVVNAEVWTGDADNPSATAFIIRDGKFIYVGDEAGARAKAHADAEVLNADGKRIVPGLIDAHMHLIDGGFQLSRLNLRDVPDKAAFVAAVAERAKHTPPGQWIQGGRWSTDSWATPAPPARSWIDAVTPNNPVLLSRMDGHAALANRIALDKAGIDSKGPQDPPGGVIERDPTTHEPTGILKDAAVDLVRNQIPKPTDAELDAALEAAMKHANEHGLTCVHTMSEFSHLAAFDRARKAGRLTLRIRQYISEDDWLAFLQAATKHQNDDWVRVVGFKAYADGSLGSRTAYMYQPYLDNPSDRSGWHGLLQPKFMDLENFHEELRIIADEGLAPAVHAIGDAAVGLVLGCYQRLGVDRYPKRLDPPARIEHAQHLAVGDLGRFAALGVVASMQPLHKADDARYAEKALGPDRIQRSYAFKTLIHSGAIVAFGSDWPVVSLDPFLGMHAAVTGLSLDGKPFVTTENIEIVQALTCYTRGAAAAAGDQERMGCIRTGYCGDFVLLDRDILAIDSSDLLRMHPTTYVGGRRTSVEK